MFNEIDPKLSPFYVGGFAISILKNNKELTFLDWINKVSTEIGFVVTEKLFVLSIAWLFAINMVEETSRGYKYVSN